MNFLDLVKKRQSTRVFTDKPVRRELIEKCIEAARLAPSACNSQPWKFVIVDNTKLKNEIAKYCKSNWISINSFSEQPPAYAVVVTEIPMSPATIGGIVKHKDYNLIDTGIAAEHFCLQATEQGLGTCIMGWFDEEKVKKLLKIPKNKRVNVIIAVGYAPKDYKLRKKARKSIEEIRKYNSF